MSRCAVVFVHGLFSSPSAWDAFRDLLQKDDEMVETFDLAFYGYDTPYVRMHPGRKTPDLDTVAGGLDTYLATELAHYQKLILVSHSQGGLVVQRYLARALQDGRGVQLARTCGFVMFACPNSGSEFGLAVRRAVKLWSHPQEQELRPLAPSVLETQRIVLERVVFASVVDPTHCPIPVIAYAGETDGVVPPASAMAVYPTVGVLPGDHSSIIRPDTPAHRSYAALRADLLRLLRSPEVRPAGPPVVPGAAEVALPHLSVSALAPMVDALLALDEMVDGASRRQIISYLPPHVRAVVPEGATPRLHVIATVRTCAGFGEFGRQALEEALALAVGSQRLEASTVSSAMRTGWPDLLASAG